VDPAGGKPAPDQHSPAGDSAPSSPQRAGYAVEVGLLEVNPLREHATDAESRTAPLRSAACCVVTVAGLRRSPAEIAARAGHSVNVLLPSTPTAYQAMTKSPADESSRPSASARGARLAHENTQERVDSVRHASVSQLDALGHRWGWCARPALETRP
jgi:hypothetical protein